MARSEDRDIEIPLWVRRYGAIAWRLLGIAAAVYVLAHFVARLTTLVVPVAVALLLTAVLHPIVERVHRPHWPDWLVPLATVLLVLGPLALGCGGTG